jgi:hypothetical protein
MPTPEEVAAFVLREISKASGVPTTELKPEHKLKTDLAISHVNFVVLAQNLRAFIKQHKPTQTLVLKEIETAAATVLSVVQLVQGRV